MIGPGIDYLVSDICLLSSLTKSELSRFAKDKTVVFAKRKIGDIRYSYYCFLDSQTRLNGGLNLLYLLYRLVTHSSPLGCRNAT